jgi:hypothetical protein
MTDLTDYNIDLDEPSSSSGGSKLEEGRYNLDYAGDPEDDEVPGRNGYLGMKILFEIQGTTIIVSALFTLKHNDPKNVEIGRECIKKFAKACGLSGGLKHTNQLINKSVSCELKRNDRGYLEIADNFGNAWQPATTSKPNSEEKDGAVNETVPF